MSLRKILELVFVESNPQVRVLQRTGEETEDVLVSRIEGQILEVASELEKIDEVPVFQVVK